MSTFNFNGGIYSGNSMSVINGEVFIDGKEVDNPEKESKQIIINVQGNIGELKVDSCDKIEVNGNVEKLKLTSGNVTCNIVEENVSLTTGNINCGTIKGDAKVVTGNINRLS